MKKIIIFILIIISVLNFQNCKNKDTNSQENHAYIAPTVGIAQKYKLDTSQSKVTWSWGKNNGIISLSNGEFSVLENTLTTGAFDLDMKNLSVINIENIKLDTLLHGNAYFETNKYPLAHLAFIKIDALAGDTTLTHKIKSELILKGIKNAISIPSKIIFENDKIIIKIPNLEIKSSEWNINTNLTKNKNDFFLKMTLVAKK